MGRSQRHMLWEQGSTAAGEIHAEGVVAPGIAMQVDPEELNALVPGPALFNTGLERAEPLGDGSVEVPVGAPGGPLSGSTLTGAIPEERLPPPTPEPPEPGPDPAPGEEPTVEYLAPAEAVMGSTDFTMRVVGTNFTDSSIIVFNRGEENTGFVSDTELTTIVKPSLAGVAVDLPVLVRQGTVDSNEVMFSFTEAEEGREAGPFNITLIEDHMEGLALTLDGGEYKVGDDVSVEATGNTSVNGAYEILEVNGLIIVIDSSFELPAPIEAKGRLTITGAMP
jgi:hypothetical protein